MKVLAFVGANERIIPVEIAERGIAARNNNAIQQRHSPSQINSVEKF